ncbi:alpha/beta-hydrolase [Plenodomus tracheiphilus IPT5]|uniref:Kynurenine formamidase n=1 Tax=Plenodomus tracheiphilus IPT5 TaxID=1408161 RepID=A0A6A7BNG6_9PLEO|nr:alpha/beta-hydrolase [Plenodomus tracheiphilus IPT5]
MSLLTHHPAIPYSDPPSRLRTLDIWLPRPNKANEKPTPNLPWLIYLHGGAWRDPTQTSTTCLTPTLHHLLTTHATTLSQISGIASLNYRLSPYPAHPTHPSDPNDADRNVKHPDHMRDVQQGLRHLQRNYGVEKWIGIGHSCGATLLLQIIGGLGVEPPPSSCPPTSASPSQQQQTTPTIIGPDALVLLEGIYNIPLFLRNHAEPACPPHIAKIYAEIIAGAFGRDKAVEAYQAVSPVAGRYGKQQWPEGRLMVVCHSYEDELVERAQRDVLCVALDREGWSIVMEEGDDEDEVRAEGRRVLNIRDLKGGHDFVWEDGRQVARLVAEVVQRLS